MISATIARSTANDRQGDLLDVAGLARSLIETDSFYTLIHRLGPVLVTNEDSSEMYSKNIGRPSLSPSLLPLRR